VATPEGKFETIEQPGRAASFAKGGCGCLLAFLIGGLFVVVLGGRVHLDVGGALMLFLVGGVIALMVRAGYIRGQRDGLAGTRGRK